MTQSTLSLAQVRRYLDLTGAQAEVDGLIQKSGKNLGDGAATDGGHFNLKAVQVELVDTKDKERASAMAALRAKQNELLFDMKGRDEELAKLQDAEAEQRESLILEREERDRIRASLHRLQTTQLDSIQKESMQELARLQRERELLMAREKEKADAIEEIRLKVLEQDKKHHEAIRAASIRVTNVKERPSLDTGTQKGGGMGNNATTAMVKLAHDFGVKSAGLLKEQESLQKQKDVLIASSPTKKRASAGNIRQRASVVGLTGPRDRERSIVGIIPPNLQNAGNINNLNNMNNHANANTRKDSLEALLSDSALRKQRQRVAALKSSLADESETVLIGEFDVGIEQAREALQALKPSSGGGLPGEHNQYNSHEQYNQSMKGTTQPEEETMREVESQAYLEKWLEGDAKTLAEIGQTNDKWAEQGKKKHKQNKIPAVRLGGLQSNDYDEGSPRDGINTGRSYKRRRSSSAPGKDTSDMPDGSSDYGDINMNGSSTARERGSERGPIIREDSKVAQMLNALKSLQAEVSALREGGAPSRSGRREHEGQDGQDDVSTERRGHRSRNAENRGTAVDQGGGFGSTGVGGGSRYQQLINQMEADNARLQMEMQQLAMGGFGPMGMHGGMGMGQMDPLTGQLHMGMGGGMGMMPPGPQQAPAGGPLSARSQALVALESQHKADMKKIEYEMEKLELEQRLSEIRERVKREKDEKDREAKHAADMAQSARNLEALQVEHAMARERRLAELQAFGPSEAARKGQGGAVERTYNKDVGFSVLWDYLANVDIDNLWTGKAAAIASKHQTKIRLAYGLYIGTQIQGKMQSTAWLDLPTSNQPQALQNSASATGMNMNNINNINDNNGLAGVGKNASKDPSRVPCTLEVQAEFPGVVTCPQARLIMELQLKSMAPVTGKDKPKGSIGWASLYVFKPEKFAPTKLTARAGLLKLPLISGSVDLLQAPPTPAMIYTTNMPWLYLRLVHGKDTRLSHTTEFIIHPNTSHLYTLPTYVLAKSAGVTFFVALFIIKIKGSGKRRRHREHVSMILAGKAPPFAGTKMLKPKQQMQIMTPVPRAADAISEAGSTDDENDMSTDGTAIKEKNNQTPVLQNEEPGSDSINNINNINSGRGINSSDSTSSLAKMEQKRGSISSNAMALMSAKSAIHRRKSLENMARSSSSRKPFSNTDGYDVYIDKALGLPETCTITRVSLKAFNKKGEQLHGSQGDVACVVADPLSACTAPDYHLREEYRASAIPLSIITNDICLLIRVDTIERATVAGTGGFCAVGYSLFPTFVDEAGYPFKGIVGADVPVYLREGNWQIPLYTKPPAAMTDLHEGSLVGIPRVPCASLLIRIKPAARSINVAPDSADGQGVVLSKATVPLEDWIHLGVVSPPPVFGPGVYDNHLIDFKESEHDVMKKRVEMDAPEDRVCDVGRIASSTGKLLPSPSFVNSEQQPYIRWMEKAMEGKPKRMLDYRFCTRYWPDRGFTVKIAGLVNMKGGNPTSFGKPNFYKVMYSLLSPGLAYRDPPMTDQAEFTLSYDMESSTIYPRFNDPPTLFTYINKDASQCLIIDVRSIKVDGKGAINVNPPTVKPATGGWTILPIFVSGTPSTGGGDGGGLYMAAATYRLPLFAGPFPPELLNEDYHIQAVTAGLKAQKYKIWDGSSIIVQLLNSLLPGVLPPPYKDLSIDTSVLKDVATAAGQETTKWQYDPATSSAPGRSKALDKFIPKGMTEQEFCSSLNAAFALATGVDHLGPQVQRGAAK